MNYSTENKVYFVLSNYSRNGFLKIVFLKIDLGALHFKFHQKYIEII